MKNASVIRPAEVVLDEYWSPRVVGQLNDQHIKIAKIEGQLSWHKHNEDKVFLIVSGFLKIEYEDQVVTLEAGDLHVVPGGALHNPVADEECRIIWIEPA